MGKAKRAEPSVQPFLLFRGEKVRRANYHKKRLSSYGLLKEIEKLNVDTLIMDF